MYASAMHVESAVMLSRLVPASTLGNVGAILMAALLARAGERWPVLSGQGNLMRSLEKVVRYSLGRTILCPVGELDYEKSRL